MIAKATADGERLAAQIRTHAQQEAEEARERALRDIETARNQALSEIYSRRPFWRPASPRKFSAEISIPTISAIW